jgi:hypothetical protein
MVSDVSQIKYKFKINGQKSTQTLPENYNSNYTILYGLIC